LVVVGFVITQELGGDWKQALVRFCAAAKLGDFIGTQYKFADVQLRRGILYSKRGNYRRAIAVLRQGLTALRDNTLLKMESELHEALAIALDAIGEHPEAFAHMKEHALIQQRLFSEERQRAVAEMQARFDVERAEREREMFRLKSEHLEEMMEQKSKELTAAAMHLVQKNSFLQKLRKDTVGLAKENPLVKGPFTTLLRAIDENLHDDDGWQRFEQEFQLVHHDFMRLLSQRYPNLTPGELKVCALLKVNLSNKEIANLLSVSIRNVESHRYWIRKKMELSSDVNLSVYLAGM
jgi:DNA-binding CsgD family transcriptional regulator